MLNSHQSIDEACIDALRYFALFSYPLKSEEVHRFLPMPASIEEVDAALVRLASQGRLFTDGEYHFLAKGDSQVKMRKEAYHRAMGLLEKAPSYVRIIAAFPFVEGIAISGSLSKYQAGPHADIDYFIITSANRLWIARSLLHLFKKLTFLTGHQHYFCMNYFIDTKAMTLTDENIYAAIETVTLLPAYNAPLIARLEQDNAWIRDYLPNAGFNRDHSRLIGSGKVWCKTLAEFLLNRLWPDSLNHWLMGYTNRKWRKKWAKRNYNPEAYERAFHTTLHISKNHPADYQEKIIHALTSENTNFRYGER